MERNATRGKRIWSELSVLMLAVGCLTLLPHRAAAGVVFASDRANARAESEEVGPKGEVYPESRFGQPPAKVDVGVGRSYAARAVEEMDGDPAFGKTQVSRDPAGLMFKEEVYENKPRTLPLRSEVETASVGSSELMPQSTLQRKGVQEISIIAGDLGFFPKTIFVTRDVPVRLFVTGASKEPLCLMMDSFQIKRQVRSQRIEEIGFIPSTPGRYRFFCPVNNMEGTLVVKEFATPIEDETKRIPASVSSAEGTRKVE